MSNDSSSFEIDDTELEVLVRAISHYEPLGRDAAARGLQKVPGTRNALFPWLQTQACEEILSQLRDPSQRTDRFERNRAALRAGRHPIYFEMPQGRANTSLLCGVSEVVTIDAALMAYRKACASGESVPAEVPSSSAEIVAINTIRLKLYRGIPGMEDSTYEEFSGADDI